MTKTRTTTTLVLIALVLGIAALFAVPPTVVPEVFSDQGEVLFPDLEDQFASKEIVVYEQNEETGEDLVFHVKFEQGLWRIPSHDGYPADATERMAAATASLIGLKKDIFISDRLEDRAACGVEDPLDNSVGMAGKGKRIQLKDASGHTLADVIVGQEVEDKRNWAYMRIPDKKRIYAVNLRPGGEGQSGEDLADLSTTFGDWIDTDLLGLARNDIEKINIANYSVDEETSRVDMKEEIELSMSDGSTWSIAELAEEEETKQATVRDIVSALDDLKIAGVRPMPETLNTLTQMNLISKGFFPDPEGHLYGNEGHLNATSKDGIIYTLFFGEVVFGSGEALTAGTETAAAEEEEGGGAGDENGKSENRYLLVRVRVAPELEEQPEEVAAAEKADQTAAGTEGEATTGEAEAGSADDEKDDPVATAREEWQAKLDTARKKVDELNLRFSKWYFVIDGESFDKLHKSRADLIEPKVPDISNLGEQPAEGRQPVKKPSGLAYYELEYGSGQPALKGAKVKVLYTGWLKDGTEFDKSVDRNAPFTFTLGRGEVIPGWDEGVESMRPGGKRKLIVPPELGYGAAGAGTIPPDSTLIFDVELIAAENPESDEFSEEW